MIEKTILQKFQEIEKLHLNELDHVINYNCYICNFI